MSEPARDSPSHDAPSRGTAALSGYRVLDLSSGGSLLCGKVLADLGADVIKVEPPGGDPSRQTGPFYKDQIHPEKSLFWFSYNTGKRSITLNLESPDGQALLRRLASTAHFLVESFPPGRLADLGLGYEDLAGSNPALVYTSITAFGQSGPYAHYRASDLLGWAMGGYLWVTGDPDRPPVWIGVPQAWLHAGAEAATASLVAHWYRGRTGQGQHVDVSMQQCVVWTLMNATSMWSLEGNDERRLGPPARSASGVLVPRLFELRDGYCHYQMGGTRERPPAIVKWMAAAGVMDDFLRDFDWAGYNPRTVDQETMDRIMGPIAAFLKTKTKVEAYDEATKRGILLMPVNTAADIAQDAQLAARDYWVPIEHPELEDTLVYPGAFVKLSESPWRVGRRAPLVGEHNQEVYGGELDLTAAELAALREAGVI